MNFGLFKKFNHRKFDYKPRYYDEDKANLDALVGKYNKDLDQTELSKRRISTGFASKKSKVNLPKNASRSSNIRLVLIVGFLCYLSYLFLISDKFLQILESLT